MTVRQPIVVRRPVPGALQRLDPASGVLAIAMLAAAIVLMYAGRHLSFFYDEWDWILQRRSGALSSYLDPHNGHFSLVPVAVYKALFLLVGLHHYWPYRAILTALHLLSAFLLYVLIRRRVGPWLALAPVVLLLFMGAAYHDLLWPFQMGFLASVAAGLGAIALLDDGRSPALACGLLTVSVASSGLGIPFLAATTALLLVRREPWQQLWIVAVPAAVFLIWYVGWGGGESTSVSAVLGAPKYIAEAAADATAGMAGLNPRWGTALLALLLVVATISWQRNVAGPPSPLLAAAVVGALAFWGLTAIVRDVQPEPGASRYLYIGAVFLWLVLAEAHVGLGLRGPWLIPLLLLVLGALVANLELLRTNARTLATTDENVRASLTAIELAAPLVQPAFVPAPVGSPQITAGPYLRAARALGSPAFTVAELERAGLSLQQRGDGVLEQAERLALAPGTGSGTPCHPAATAGTELYATPGRAVVLMAGRSAPGRVYLRRFASTYAPVVFATVARGSTRVIRFPVDRAPSLPWHVLLRGPGAAGCSA